MKVNVVLFAQARDVLGADQLQLEMGDCPTVGDLKRALVEQHPELQEILGHCSIAVDQEYSIDETPLRNGCEVGLIPPVSGG